MKGLFAIRRECVPWFRSYSRARCEGGRSWDIFPSPRRCGSVVGSSFNFSLLFGFLPPLFFPLIERVSFLFLATYAKIFIVDVRRSGKKIRGWWRQPQRGRSRSNEVNLVWRHARARGLQQAVLVQRGQLLRESKTGRRSADAFGVSLLSQTPTSQQPAGRPPRQSGRLGSRRRVKSWNFQSSIIIRRIRARRYYANRDYGNLGLWQWESSKLWSRRLQLLNSSMFSSLLWTSLCHRLRISASRDWRPWTCVLIFAVLVIYEVKSCYGTVVITTSRSHIREVRVNSEPQSSDTPGMFRCLHLRVSWLFNVFILPAIRA